MGIEDWGHKQGLKGIRNKIEKAIKQNRLVFLGDNHVLYTDKDGQKTTCNFAQAVQLFIDVSGWNSQMATLYITNQDIENILVELYAKQKKEAK